MSNLPSIALVLLAGLTCIPVIAFVAEVAAALLPSRREVLLEPEEPSGSPTAILIPAHNESSHLIPTLKDVRAQIRGQDRLIVVADNCDDDTAAIAAAHGAEVLVRNDKDNFGKGYALAWGLSEIQTDPPEFVVFIDADCRVQHDALTKLRMACRSYRRPVQACFMMRSAEDSPINHSLAEFAWIIKNWVRPLGLRKLRCPVQLMGTGMIFAWADVTSVSLASGHLVEDLKLGLELAAKGKAARFLPAVTITSFFPTSSMGVQTQRQRWVHGHLSMIARLAPRGFVSAIVRGNLEYLVLLLDLIVPPLSLLGLLLVSEFILSSIVAAFGCPLLALEIGALNLFAFVLILALAWLRFGRGALPVKQIGLLIPAFFEKLRLYNKIASGQTSTEWIRTDRTGVP